MGAFRFKQFEVVQEHSAMKVNTDAVLLGAWVSVPGTASPKVATGDGTGATDIPLSALDIAASQHISALPKIKALDIAASQHISALPKIKALDIGTGTGVIALMVGQRIADACAGPDANAAPSYLYTAILSEIHAVEIDSGACKDAAANFAAAPWEGISFSLYNVPLQEFSGEDSKDLCAGKIREAGGYHLIVSNPPYFISSLKNDSAAKSMARHTDTLSQRELLYHSTALLAEGGIFAVILPVAEGEELLRKVEFMAQAAEARCKASMPHCEEAATHCEETATHCEEAATHCEEAVTHCEETVTHCKEAVTHCEEAVNKKAVDTQNTWNKGNACQMALFPSRICYVHTTEHKPAKRLMLEFVKCHPSARPALQHEQLIMMSGGSYTPEYTSLVGDFYLWG